MTYQIIDSIVVKHDPAGSAAEIHGVASGMLCLDGRVESMIWFAEVFQDAVDLLEEEKTMLVSLFDQTRELLAGDDFGFDLFIPDEEFTLDEQAEGVRNWCQGFLFGAGFVNSSAEWSGESQEIINDIVEFTKLELDSDVPEDEQALMEIHEYLRAAVMLIAEQSKDDNGSERQQIH